MDGLEINNQNRSLLRTEYWTRQEVSSFHTVFWPFQCITTNSLLVGSNKRSEIQKHGSKKEMGE